MEKSSGTIWYLDVGKANDLKSPKNRAIYRLLEILPGFLSWITLLFVILGSWLMPVFIAFFIIAFDVYWLLKTLYFSFHLRSSYNQMKKNLAVNWLDKLKREININNWQNIYHLIILPFYKESFDVLDATFKKLIDSNYPKDKFIVVLASEERAGQHAQGTARQIEQKYGSLFFKFLITVHPKDIPGELAGKGSNETWAGKKVKEKIIDSLNIPYENIIVSVFDIDTQVYPDYFGCLTYHYLTCENPLKSSFQPIPIYNNNIWEAPAFSRVVAASGTFWHMMQQERSERLATFSSHSMNFKTLVQMNFWNTKNVSEDSRIFWKCLLFHNGDYQTVPLYYPVSMDANLAPTLWQTIKNIYRQQRRWGWGAENIPYLIFGFLKNKKIPFLKKIRYTFNQLEGFWSWATNALILFMLGWLPLYLGGQKFNETMLSYNLPQITRILMTLAMIGIFSSAVYSTILLPPRPTSHPWRKYFYMIFQWAMLPFTIIFFGAIPGLDAQTRLMIGKYMGFWVTPKERTTLKQEQAKIA